MDWMRILFFGNAQLTYTDTSLCVAAGFAGKNTRGNTFRLNLNTNIILEVTSSNSFRIVCTIWAGRYFHQNNAPCYGSTYRKEYFVFEVRIIMRRSRRTEVQEILLDDTEMRECERRYETTWGGRRKERNYQYERFHSSIKVLVYLK